jgi:hypothetical protein
MMVICVCHEYVEAEVKIEEKEVPFGETVDDTVEAEGEQKAEGEQEAKVDTVETERRQKSELGQLRQK